MTVAELINTYRVTNLTERRREDARHGRWWGDQLGDMPADRLTADGIQRQLHTLAKRGRSESTQNFYLRFLRRVCVWALTVGYLSADPCKTIPLPKEKTPTLRVLTLDEERALCQALGMPYALWVRFAILTGLKQSEQFTLRWRDVDLDRAACLLPHPSTGGVMALQLSAESVTVLRELRRIHPVSLWVFPDLRTPTRPANVHAFYVGRWESAISRAGLVRCAWRDLRHTCGVRLAQQGLSVREITAVMRQKEDRMAYTYRAWQPGQGPHAVKPVRVPVGRVFSQLTPEGLHALLGRDVATAPLTFAEIAHLYATHHLASRPGRLDFEGCYRQYWQGWATRLADSLTRKEVRLWHTGLSHIPSHANHALTYLKALYNWALRMEIVTCVNPAYGQLRFREYAREQFLSMEEAQRFMRGLSHVPLKPRAVLLTLILTGSRLGEVRCMRWSEIDRDSRLWQKSRTKNGTTHMLPLPRQVMDVLNQLPKTCDWVFPGSHDTPWSEASAEKMWRELRGRLGMADVRLHDLRRTCASYLAINGENLPIIQSVLNHHSLAPTSVYARLNTKATDRALQGQADRLCSLFVGVEGNAPDQAQLETRETAMLTA